MVTLYVGDLDQLTFLEFLLKANHIDYEIQLADGRYGLDAPYIMVHGVPLDEKRAISWIQNRLED